MVNTVSRGTPWNGGVLIDLWIPGADPMSNPQLAAAMLAAFRTGWLETPFDVSEVGVCVLSTTEPTAEEWKEDQFSIRYHYELTGVNKELSALLPGNRPGIASSCYWTYLSSTLELDTGPTTREVPPPTAS